MKLNTLSQAWQAKNPGGNIWIMDSNGQLSDSGKQTGKFAVTYNQDGKIYTYTYKSVYKLAERLNMIPDSNLDYWQESVKAIESMDNGIEFISICGLSDTIRHIITEKTGQYPSLIHSDAGLDEWDRPLYKFTSYKLYNDYNEYAKDNNK